MTPKLAEKLAPERPALVMPTIWRSIPTLLTTKLHTSKDDTFNIVYTGNLSHSYGVDLLLETFKQAHRSNWHLLISGWGEMEEAVREFAMNNPQVEYLGLLDSRKVNRATSACRCFYQSQTNFECLTPALRFPLKLLNISVQESRSFPRIYRSSMMDSESI